MGQIELSNTSNSNFAKMRPSQLTGSAKWADIEDLINRWARRNPQGAWLNEQWIKEAQADLMDKKYGRMGGGEDKGTGITNRYGICIHPELMNYIQAFYPTFMDTKEEMHEFMRRFPKFRIPEKI
jgi:hypothetical protein